MMAKYKVYVTGECFGTSETIEAKTDIGAKRAARKYHNPHQSNWQWYGSTILTKADTGESWILEAGNEKAGWQSYEEA
jgi:hypothetical protein